MVSRVVDSHALHVVMLMLALPISLHVIWGEISSGGSEWFVAAAMAGLGLMIVAVSVTTTEAFETLLTVIGGTLLASAHIWRWTRLQPRSSSELTSSNHDV